MLPRLTALAQIIFLPEGRIFHSMLSAMKKYVVELIGTMFLVFAFGNALISQNALAPIAIGLMLMVMIYAGGHISGGHFNPAVTIAVWLRGKCDKNDVIPFILCQIVGAVIAALIVKFLRGAGNGGADFITSKVIVAELLGTFAWAWLVLNVAIAKGTSGNSFYGAAIGMTVTAGAFAVGDISGAIFNPAVAIAAVAMKLIQVKFLWVYLVVGPLAGVIAAKVFKSTSDD
jgi:aquaporin Z